jgi:hypothetical protein
MAHLTKGVAVLVVASMGLAAAGCNKGPAEASLKAAEQALETARPELERYTPGELASLSATVQEARARFEQGSYTEALKSAQALPAKIQAALAAANEKKAELTAAWTEMAGSLPRMVEALTAKVNDLAGMRSLPRGMDKARVETAKSELGAITQAWTAATDAFQGGDIPRAVSTARDIKAKAESLAGAIGLAIAAPPAPAGTPAPQ